MLNKFVSVYVPGTKDVNIPLRARDQKVIALRVAKELSSHFGGNTITTATGTWINSEGQLITERILVCRSYHDQDSTAALSIAKGIARRIKAELTQESVTVESEAGIEFI